MKKTYDGLIALLLAALVTGPLGAAAASDPQLVVNRTDDPKTYAYGDGQVSFREAVAYANTLALSARKITFDPLLWRNGSVACAVTSGVLKVSGGLTVEGPSADLVSLDAHGLQPILEVSSGDPVVLSGLTFRNGRKTGNGGSLLLGGAGAHEIRDSVFCGNSCTLDGACVYYNGGHELKVSRCRFEDNAAGDDGGAVYCRSGRVSVSASSFVRNTAGWGGAMAGEGSFEVLASTFVLNAVLNYGGGYHGSASPEAGATNAFVNSTFRGNSAIKGGGAVSVINKNVRVKLQNVVATGNKSQEKPEAADVYYDQSKGKIQAQGLVAYQVSGFDENESERVLIGRETCADVRVFAKPVGTQTIVVGGTMQYVEPLNGKAYNPALSGNASVDSHVEITGRSFSANQMGSLWVSTASETPSLTVTSLGDVADATDGQVTLRDILDGIAAGDARYQALKKNGKYAVGFAAGLSGTLRMTGHQFAVAGSGLSVSVDGGDRVTILGDGLHRAFYVGTNATLELKNLSFVNCLGAVTSSSLVTTSSDGGAILNLGELSATSCAFGACSAGETAENPIGNGGAVANGSAAIRTARATLTDCSFSDCRAARGGAVYNYGGNAVTLTGCSFESNRTGGGTAVLTAAGGALCNAQKGDLAYDGCLFTDNTAELDGVMVPSDITDLGAPHYSVRVNDGALAVDLNELALPDLTGADVTVDLVSSGDRVSICPGNVKPNLYYGLGHATVLGAAFVVEPDGWVQADADGQLPSPLTAPKDEYGNGFYRIYVAIRPGQP